MRRNSLVAVLATALVLILAPGVAAAYNETGTVDPAITSCAACHGATTSTGTLEAGRFGPHGAYTSTSKKCAVCHHVHQAPLGGIVLLEKATIVATCNTCHDGTGGRGVYGVLVQRGFSVATSHSIDLTNNVPGGNAVTGDSATMTFSGQYGRMTCTDCHSPHGSRTVAAYYSERKRTATDAPYTRSTRLLKRRPGGIGWDITVYGSNWCAACHKGRISDMGAINHPVETTAQANYFYVDRVMKVPGTSTPTTQTPSSVMTTGTLAGSNGGFIQMLPRPWGTAIHYPICQQCHGDRRYAGNLSPDGTAARAGTWTISAADGVNATDNPRFQVFPHESTDPFMLLESDDDLCTNCHPVDNPGGG